VARVSPLDNDIAQPAGAAPLRLDRLVQVDPVVLPATLDNIEATARLVLERAGNFFDVVGGGRRLQQQVPSVQGGICRIAGNNVDVIYTPPDGFNGLDACVYVAVDRFGNTGAAVVFFIVGLDPTLAPTIAPTLIPSLQPTLAPTIEPSLSPTLSPTLLPTLLPSISPTLSPTLDP